MSEENKLHQEDENKEVTSTQAAPEEHGQKPEGPKEKVIQSLPMSNVKPQATFKLFSYTGDNCRAKIMNWIRMYENLAKRSNWSDEDMKWNLSSYLEDDAFDFYVEHILVKDLNWKQAKQSMVNRFDQFEIEPFMEFLSYKWSPQTDLKDYFKKMRALGVAAGIKEEDILVGLTRGLPVHLRTELSYVTSLGQWVAIAFCLQQNEKTHGSHYNKHQPWKNRNGRGGGRQNRQQKSRSSRQNNLPAEHPLLQNVNGPTTNQDANHHEN